MSKVLITSAIPYINGVKHLVGFLERVGLDGVKRLLAVPRTAVLGPQTRHDFYQPVELLARVRGRVGGHRFAWN